MTRFGALIGYQRSGTHMIGGAVDSHPDAIYTNEVFYRHVPQTQAEIDKVLREFLGERRLVFLDVKLNQISPAVVKFLKTIPVISIYRGDHMRHYYSGELHEYKHAQNGGKRVRDEITFNLDRDKFNDIQNDVETLYKRYRHLSSFEMVYEHITDNRHVDNLGEETSARICDVLGLEYRLLTTSTQKQAPENIKGLLI